MSHLQSDMEAFCLKFSKKTDISLQQVYRDTWVNVLYPQMLTNELQGHILTMLSKTIQPDSILEIGTFTAYSAICLAQGLAPGGMMISIEINTELESRIARNLQDAGLSEQVHVIFSDACEMLLSNDTRICGPFNLMYIDADKASYPIYLKECYERLATGGLLLADNVFWGGKSFSVTNQSNRETDGVKNFLTLAQQLEWQHHAIIPVGDGLFMGLK